MFAHSVEIKDFTPTEKFKYLVFQSAEKGFELKDDNHCGSTFSKKSLSVLSSDLSDIITERLSQPGPLQRTIQLNEFNNFLGSDIAKDSFSDLQNMVGLNEVKKRIKEILIFLTKRGKEAVPCLHMVFRGNPGTGKTTVARLLGQIFAEAEILARKDVFVETDREGLVGLYIGHTAIKTADKVKEAMGGILFIDEAYSLGLYDRGHDFGEEVLSTLVKRMEDYRKEFICIMTGYPAEMDKMLVVNPGLRDRIQFFIDFPDYTAVELLEIFCGYCTAEYYEIEVSALEFLRGYLDKIVKFKERNFANARLIRKVFERVRIKQALRADDNLITADDIHSVFQEKDISELIKLRTPQISIGFKP